MKFLIGILSGITLAGAGFVMTSGALSTATATAGIPTAQTALASQSALAVQSTPRKPNAVKRLHAFTGELSRSDTGAIELKLTSLQNGESVDRDVRILVAHAIVTNRAGSRIRVPLEDATARVTGVLLARSAWRLDGDGQPLATIAAKRIVITARKAPDQTDAQDTQRPGHPRHAGLQHRLEPDLTPPRDPRRGGRHSRPSSTCTPRAAALSFSDWRARGAGLHPDPDGGRDPLRVSSCADRRTTAPSPSRVRPRQRRGRRAPGGAEPRWDWARDHGASIRESQGHMLLPPSRAGGRAHSHSVEGCSLGRD